ncbi:ABC transporter permease [Streptomyces sp. NPDC003077]|uniref:ABC transporter permease n=1 Tax=Streptomyces sp. NPDC003077 TaxID=3154443 RepID=UPI0033A7BB4F
MSKTGTAEKTTAEETTAEHHTATAEVPGPGTASGPGRTSGFPTTRPTGPRRYIRAGLRRGVIELRHVLRNRKELSGHLLNIVIAVAVVMVFDKKVPGTPVPLGHLSIAGFAAFLLFSFGLMSVPQILVTEREEGALLRLRATPGGIPAYLLAKALLIVGLAVGSLVLLLGVSALVADGPLPAGPAQWLTLIWVTGLGLLAVVPLGAAIGAVLPNPREAVALVALPAMVLLGISGALFPADKLPQFVQQISAVFPLKWMAQGVRASLLPDSMLAAEAAGSWQLPQVAMVLAAWAVFGFLLAVPLLRRTTRRESGSRLAARQQKAAAGGGASVG